MRVWIFLSSHLNKWVSQITLHLWPWPSDTACWQNPLLKQSATGHIHYWDKVLQATSKSAGTLHIIPFISKAPIDERCSQCLAFVLQGNINGPPIETINLCLFQCITPIPDIAFKCLHLLVDAVAFASLRYSVLLPMCIILLLCRHFLSADVCRQWFFRLLLPMAYWRCWSNQSLTANHNLWQQGVWWMWYQTSFSTFLSCVDAVVYASCTICSSALVLMYSKFHSLSCQVFIAEVNLQQRFRSFLAYQFIESLVYHCSKWLVVLDSCHARHPLGWVVCRHQRYCLIGTHISYRRRVHNAWCNLDAGGKFVETIYDWTWS